MLKVSNASNNPAKGNKVADVCYLTDKHSDAIYKVRVRACEACGLLAGFFFESIVGPEIVLFRNGLLPKIFLKRVRTTAATQSADCTGLAKLPETNRQPAQALQNCRNLNGDLHEVCTTARAQSAACTGLTQLPETNRQPAQALQNCRNLNGSRQTSRNSASPFWGIVEMFCTVAKLNWGTCGNLSNMQFINQLKQ